MNIGRQKFIKENNAAELYKVKDHIYLHSNERATFDIFTPYSVAINRPDNYSTLTIAKLFNITIFYVLLNKTITYITFILTQTLNSTHF